MTVEELRERLRDCDPLARVFFRDRDDPYDCDHAVVAIVRGGAPGELVLTNVEDKR